MLTTAEMAGGVTVLVKTGATLLVKEGIKACAKAAAKELMQETASAIAAELASYAAELAGIPEEHRQYIRIGVDAYQAFAFFKAAKAHVDWDGACFAAGTNVIVGLDSDGMPLMKDIEDIMVGDYVLARDQQDAGDDLELRQVTQVFRKSSDHLRIVTIEGDDGNVETIRTTDEHPFYVQSKGWVGAGDLVVGDFVQESDGSWQTVLAAERTAFAGGIAVYNFEVQGDHTYFVEDGTGSADAVWVHNACVTPTFRATTASGRPYLFPNARPVVFTKYPTSVTQPVRTAYNGTIENGFRDGAKAEFLRAVANNPAKVAELKATGFSNRAIDRMKLGDSPQEGWEVHHKMPIEFGGTNDHENLMFIREDPHSSLSWTQQRDLTNVLEPFEQKEISWPMFEGVLVHPLR